MTESNLSAWHLPPLEIQLWGDNLLARINFEDCWWTDPRRAKLITLVGHPAMADGIMAQVWRLAQTFRGRGNGLIPHHIWETVEHSRSILEANLSTIEADGVYVRGSGDFLDWVVKKRQNAQKGGRKSAEARRANTGSAQPPPKQTRSKLEASGSKPEPSGSGSVSGSSNKNNAQPDGFADFWSNYPRKVGKGKAKTAYQKALKSGATPKDLLDALKKYREYLVQNKIEPNFIKHGSTFMNEWRDWLDPDTGQAEDFGKSKQGTGEFTGGWAEIDGVV